MGFGSSSIVVVLACVAAVVATLAWPILAFMAVRALTRIANQLEELNRRK